NNGSPPPEDERMLHLTAEEEQWVTNPRKPKGSHFVPLSQQPFTVSHAFNDSPAGLAAWVGEKLRDWSDTRDGHGLSLDWIVGTIALFWFTGTIGSSSLLYHDHAAEQSKQRRVTTPTAVIKFKKEF